MSAWAAQDVSVAHHRAARLLEIGEHREYQTAAVPCSKAGVTIMAGTDAGYLNSFDYPAIGLHQELALYVEMG
jgi:hypothetical protein